MDANTVVITLALVGLLLLLIVCAYIVAKLAEIHHLVNSRLSEALARIDKLEKLLSASGQPVPPPLRGN